MTTPQPTLRSRRLTLRPLELADVDLLLVLDADPEVRRFVDQPDAPGRQDALAALPEMTLRYGPRDEPGFWIAHTRAGTAFCGWFHLRPLEGDLRTLDLGYRLRRECWGQGLATEGSRLLVDRAFRVLGAERVVAHALTDNLASRRVLEKVGLRERKEYLHDGRLPAVAYELTRERFDAGSG